MAKNLLLNKEKWIKDLRKPLQDPLIVYSNTHLLDLLICLLYKKGEAGATTALIAEKQKDFEDSPEEG